ncbi:hypothetical protein [Nocardioides humi]|uniref:Uncharacterized protein n=1 Tax=Nocardioides humi TaxID=449461 RepID=A0ABN2BF03_9ACTN|nr:hypothetical protein [Nocardioides humi]
MSFRAPVVAMLSSLLLLTGTVALAGPAHAGGWTYDDEAGDVATTIVTETSISTSVVPEQENGDIVRVVAKHKARKVTIAVRVRTRLTGPFALSSAIRTPGGRFLLMSTRIPGMGGTEMMDFKSKSEDPTVRCRGLKRTLNGDRTVIRISIPRSCLGNPRWFRFSVGLSTFNPFTGDSYDDDGLATAMTLFGLPVMSPKVKR